MIGSAGIGLACGVLVISTGVVAGDSSDPTPEVGDDCLSHLVIPKGPVVTFVDYDNAAGAIEDLESLSAVDPLDPLDDALSERYAELAMSEGIELPLAILRPYSFAVAGPVGVADVRCAISKTGQAESLLLRDGAAVDEAAWTGSIAVDGNHMAVALGEGVDLGPLLAEPSPADADGPTRQVLSRMSELDAFQGYVSDFADVAGAWSGIGERAGSDGVREIVIVWHAPELSEQDLTSNFEAAVADHEDDDDDVLDLDGFVVTASDGWLTATTRIADGLGIARSLVQIFDPLVTPVPPSQSSE